ncbi:MAG TPA: hypothetical protein VNU68_02050 [Verrucomicrobiae bacterium]|nr:hypothetical protein [Verrucomicrobiae bacterium]
MSTITILPDGTVEFLGDTCPLDLPLANPVRRRVSTIQPTVWWKRTAFLFLRRVCGERGRVAAFTRRWKGPWKAVILATGQSAVFDSRQAAIDWEYQVLTGPKFDL